MRKLRAFGVAAVMAATTVVGLGATAGASTGHHVGFGQTADVGMARPQVEGATDIMLSAKGKAEFEPNTIGGQRCYPNPSFAVDNMTTSNQQLTYHGSVIDTIRHGHIATICDTTAGTYVYGLTGSRKTLTVTIK